ncbi:glucose oxidase [Fomitiporia mediterranea MF3/22]|uniref:glucose oxidase n=1 Tax=Fomitiporia mediterranea (strain MF3/22) TaxID=694068 RepID=UPI0004408A55|nr:glucose oxidase [Fomitiporia mediterranea MF3/22]EJC99460.1 glucose oxidase [Fomitiporia mediterranea MF3/22]
MSVHALLLFLPLLVSAQGSSNGSAFGVTSDSTTASNQTFDYIIVGGGLAGLTVAGRLSEDSSKTVLVIEVGNDDRTNPNISDIYNVGAALGTSLAWRWPTVDGKGLMGGRTLGGSSSINGGKWTRGMKDQYDAFSQFLSDEDASMNWNFDSLFSYMKKAENFTTPDATLRALGADSVSDYHGFSGPVHAAFPQEMFTGPQQPAYIDAITNLTGISHCADALGGNSNCVTYLPMSINPQDDYHRSSSAMAYLTPVESDRANWLTLINHQVTKVLLSGTSPNVTATGVQFKKSDNTGETYTANARLEVILSAGVIGSPQLLQLSGIGDPSILEPLGIDVNVDLPTVGRNFRDRTGALLSHSTQSSYDRGGRGPDNVYAFVSLEQLFSESAGSNGSITADDVSSHLLESFSSWAQSQANNGLSADALTQIFGIQAGLIANSSVPVAEIYLNSGTSTIGINFWQLLPFSLGNITITDTSVFIKPKIAADFFNVDFDLTVQTALARLARKLLQYSSFDDITAGEVTPGTSVVPDDENGGTDEAWQSWIRQAFWSVNHGIGSAAMMRRDLGGVVDGKLRVYDTTNLRVVDGSILPLHVSAHPSSTLYGVAEKAADIIKSGV